MCTTHTVMVLLLPVVAFAVAMTLENAHSRRLARRERARREASLRRASLDELAADVAAIVRCEGWERFAAGCRLLSRRMGWTDRLLHDDVEDLLHACGDEDARMNRVFKRTSNWFEYYDSGFVDLHREIARRTGSGTAAMYRS
jgi:hypothetical protein